MEKKIKSLEKKYEEVKAIVNISSEKAGKL